MVAEARQASRHPNVKTVQIIFNMFRLKPAEEFFPAARTREIGILARVPFASGLLTGKICRDSGFDDHRQFNRRAGSATASGPLCPQLNELPWTTARVPIRPRHRPGGRVTAPS